MTISSSDFSHIIDNELIGNQNSGLNVGNCDYCIIDGNIIANNSLHGLSLSYVTSTNITNNQLCFNEEYGIYMNHVSLNNHFYYNTLIENNIFGTSQAFDDGTSNLWYNSVTLQGNFWSNYDLSGQYLIDGQAYSVDLYPLLYPL